MPLLLELLDIKGTIITADAMSCQKDIVKKIVGKEADYVLRLKENQATFYQAVEEHFEAAQEQPALFEPIKKKTVVDNGHGRIELAQGYPKMSHSVLSGRTMLPHHTNSSRPIPGDTTRLMVRIMVLNQVKQVRLSLIKIDCIYYSFLRKKQ